MCNVFEFLDEVRQRPDMFIRDNNLRELESMIGGYYAALSQHDIVETVPQMTRHFLYWVHYRHPKWSLCAGWAYAIAEYMKTENPLGAFFKLVDEYRLLQPVVCASVTLGPSHEPTGQRRVIGFGGRMQKPDAVSIIQYSAEPLHFLQFQYGNRLENDDLLMKGDGSYTTTTDDAKAWVRDELHVEFDEWR